MKIVAFEGGVFAGKSTMIRHLSKFLMAPVIHEYGDYAHGFDGFPTFPPVTIEASVDAVKFFLDLENQRLMDLKKILKFSDSEYVLVDRSFLSCIAYDYSIRDFLGSDVHALSSILWTLSQKIIPDIWIYLEIDFETTIQRTGLRKSVCLPQFLDPRFIKRQREFYISMSEMLPFWLTVDATQSVEMVFEKVADYVLSQ